MTEKKTSQSQESNQEPDNKSLMVGGGSAISSLLAFIGASCCVLPLLLINLGVSGVFVAQLAIFAKYKTWFLVVSLLLVSVAFWAAYRGNKKPTFGVKMLLIISVILILIAFTLPFYEAVILQWMQQR